MSSGDHSHRKSEYDDTLIRSLAIRRRLAKPYRIERNYDIPYLGGYSKNGIIIYLDKHLPRQLQIGKRLIDVTPFLVRHERIEKALIDEFKYEYAGAHEIATGEERKLVKQHRIDWDEYSKALKPYIKADEIEKLKKVPKDLDLTPYEGEKALLERIKHAQANPEKRQLVNATA